MDPANIERLARQFATYELTDKRKILKHRLVLEKDGTIAIKRIGPLKIFRGQRNQGEASTKAIINAAAHSKNDAVMKKVYEMLKLPGELDKAITELQTTGKVNRLKKVLAAIDLTSDTDTKLAPLREKLITALTLVSEKRPRDVDTLFNSTVKNKLAQQSAAAGAANDLQAVLEQVPAAQGPQVSATSFLDAVTAEQWSVASQLLGLADDETKEEAFAIAMKKQNPNIQFLERLLKAIKSPMKETLAERTCSRAAMNTNLPLFKMAIPYVKNKQAALDYALKAAAGDADFIAYAYSLRNR